MSCLTYEEVYLRSLQYHLNGHAGIIGNLKHCIQSLLIQFDFDAQKDWIIIIVNYLYIPLSIEHMTDDLAL